jgi:hypothetical protein
MWIWRSSVAARKRVKGLFRAGLYVAFVGCVFGAIQVRSARAEVRDRTLELGREMFQLAHATTHDVNKISFNGQSIWLGTSMSKDDVKTIMQRYEALCSQNRAQSADEWRSLGEKADASLDKKFLTTGMLRSGDNDNEGAIVCFTKTSTSKSTLREAVETFGKTGDLGAFGSLRYAYVKKTDSGRSHVLTAWTDEKFNIASVLPQEGVDSPGNEIPEVPRPPGTVRVVTARLEGTPFGVNTYEGTDGPEKVIAWYDDEMRKQGWQSFDPEIEQNPENVDHERPVKVHLYEKGGVVLTIASRPNGDDGKTTTGLGLAGVAAGDEFRGVSRR